MNILLQNFKNIKTMMWMILLSAVESRGIIGGEEANDGEFPYLVALKSNIGDDEWATYCGGSIVHIKMVLTSAKCSAGYINIGDDLSNLIVVAGTNYNGNNYGNVYHVDKIIVHEDFNISTSENDICIYKLLEEFDLDNNLIKVISLTSVEPNVGDIVVTAGSGLNDDNQESYKLKKLEETVGNRTICSSFTDYYSFNVTNNLLCGFGANNGRICFGDIGGSLIDKDMVLVGIGSLASCGTSEPDTFTNVFKYLDWIRQTIENNIN